MADFIDEITEREEQILQANINAVRNKVSNHKLTPKGACYYCDEPLSSEVFCDADCAHDYQKYVRRN